MASTTGDVVRTGKMFAAQSHANQQRGPGRKNLGPTANRKPNPQGTIRSTGQQVRGPDKGAGSA
jgi:hypothetical protein